MPTTVGSNNNNRRSSAPVSGGSKSPTPAATLAAVGAATLPALPNDSYASTPRSPGSAGLLSEDELTDLLRWVDSIPLSRPKRTFTRDFSDGCLCAEVIRHVNPRLVELHNYPPANSSTQKVYNWNTLSFKVLRKLGCALTDDTIQQIVQCKPGIVETVLFDIKQKLLHSVMTTAASYQPSTKRGITLATDYGGMAISVPPQLSMRKGGRGSNSQTFGGGGADSVPLAMIQQPSLMSSMPPPPLLQPVAAAAGATGAADDSGGDKDHLIATLRETVGILQEKIHKLELLLVLKDRKIHELAS